MVATQKFEISTKGQLVGASGSPSVFCSVGSRGCRILAPAAAGAGVIAADVCDHSSLLIDDLLLDDVLARSCH